MKKSDFDKIEKYIPPKKGRKHILYIIHELLDIAVSRCVISSTYIECSSTHWRSTGKRAVTEMWSLLPVCCTILPERTSE